MRLDVELVILSYTMKNKYMREALIEANKAYQKLEVPVGCVIVKDDKIIARAHNLRETNQDSLSHAETLCISKACKVLGSWRLNDCDMYCTLEPCSMCSGAIIQSRIRKLYFGASDKKTGAAGSKLNMFDVDFNHKVIVEKGVMEEEASLLLKKFFKMLRQNKKSNK